MRTLGRVLLAVLPTAILACGGGDGPAAPPPGDPEAPPRFLRTWGTRGNGNGQFQQPQGIAVDAQGNVYVVDVQLDRVQKFTTDGVFLRAWGSSGTGNGQFHVPGDIAVGSDGRVYVCDARIQVFTPDGVFVAKWEGYNPVSIAADPGGGIYVLSTNRITKLDGNGTRAREWTWDGCSGSGCGIAVGPGGEVYAVDEAAARIAKFASDGTPLPGWNAQPEDWFRPRAIATDASGNVYVITLAVGKNVEKFTSTGAFRSRWGDGEYAGAILGPYGIAVDRAGRIFISASSQRIVVFGY